MQFSRSILIPWAKKKKEFSFTQISVPQSDALLFLHTAEGHLSHRGTRTRSQQPTGPSWILWERPKRGSVCAISGWCKNSGPCVADVKASLPFHGALIWPFHWVKPKEIHVHDLCGASLHSGTVRKKKSSWLGMKRAGLCAHRTHDPWTLTFKKHHEGESALGCDWKSNMGTVNIAWQANVAFTEICTVSNPTFAFSLPGCTDLMFHFVLVKRSSSSSLRIRKRTTRRLTCLTLPTIHLAAYCIWVNEAKAVSADLIDCVKIWVSAVRRHFNPALAARWMRETSIWRLFSLTSSLTVWSWGRKQVWLNSRDCERRGRRWREGVLSKVSLGIKTKELNIKSLLVCVRDVMLFLRGALA